MGTFLFKHIIFGPVSSRRLGRSLGINVLPAGRKICNFNCVYCECGRTEETVPEKVHFPDASAISDALRNRLVQLKDTGSEPDAITFAGNGEPTLHPEFSILVDRTIQLRDEWAPQAKVAVLTNGTLIDREPVFRALNSVDQNIIKLDSGIPETIRTINQPRIHFDLQNFVESLKKFDRSFIIQTLFFRGIHHGKAIDNTTPEEINAWLAIINELRPDEVMVYSFHRATPEEGLRRIPEHELNAIAEKVNELGIKTRVTP
jgi:wyosine [tRNA(Phe)-imidazoG37] synthetase (radical SAM superfamily)